MSNIISEITYCGGIALVTLPEIQCDSGIIGEILTAIADGGVNVDMISQTAPRGSEISVSFSVSADSVPRLLPIINAQKVKYPGLKSDISMGMCKINYFDANMVHTPGVAGKVLSVLSQYGIHTKMITTATVDISILVAEHELNDALSASENAFGSQPKEVEF